MTCIKKQIVDIDIREFNLGEIRSYFVTCFREIRTRCGGYESLKLYIDQYVILMYYTSIPREPPDIMVQYIYHKAVFFKTW